MNNGITHVNLAANWLAAMHFRSGMGRFRTAAVKPLTSRYRSLAFRDASTGADAQRAGIANEKSASAPLQGKTKGVSPAGGVSDMFRDRTLSPRATRWLVGWLGWLHLGPSFCLAAAHDRYLYYIIIIIIDHRLYIDRPRTLSRHFKRN